MRFRTVAVNRPERYSIGVEDDSGRFFVSIMVSNSLVDYEEYYEIDRATFDGFRADLDSALELVDRCRHQLEDARLIIPPGPNRGSAV
jgi:hypothetical protein